MSECRGPEVDAAPLGVLLSWFPSNLLVAMALHYPGSRSTALWNVCSIVDTGRLLAFSVILFLVTRLEQYLAYAT